MLTYEEFKGKMKDNIASYLPEEYQRAEISFHKVDKINESGLEALLVKLGNMSPCIYLDEWYGIYCSNEDFEATIKEAADNFLSLSKLNVSLPDFKEARDNMICPTKGQFWVDGCYILYMIQNS